MRKVQRRKIWQRLLALNDPGRHRKASTPHDLWGLSLRVAKVEGPLQSPLSLSHMRRRL